MFRICSVGSMKCGPCTGCARSPCRRECPTPGHSRWPAGHRAAVGSGQTRSASTGCLEWPVPPRFVLCVPRRPSARRSGVGRAAEIETCSKMQTAPIFFAGTARRSLQPPARRCTTISPGVDLAYEFRPANDVEAPQVLRRQTQPSPSCPSTSGRRPADAHADQLRTAVMATTENASPRPAASAILPSGRGSVFCRTRHQVDDAFACLRTD